MVPQIVEEICKVLQAALFSHTAYTTGFSFSASLRYAGQHPDLQP